MKTHPEAMSFSVNELGSYAPSCNSYTSNTTVKDGVTAAGIEAANATSQDGSAIFPEMLLAEYSDIFRYVRFFADSEFCQCTNCSQSFTVSQYTDHITACLASNLGETMVEVLDVRINEAEANNVTKEKNNGDIKPDITAVGDNVQANVFEQCKSIFTDSDHFSDVINSYCGRQSKFHIKTEVI